MDSPVDHSQELGRRMLQGWAMLANTCPGEACAVPLLRSPDRTHTLCVNCRRETPLLPANNAPGHPGPEASAETSSLNSGAAARPHTNGALGTLRPFLGDGTSPRLANGVVPRGTPSASLLQPGPPLANGPLPAHLLPNGAWNGSSPGGSSRDSPMHSPHNFRDGTMSLAEEDSRRHLAHLSLPPPSVPASAVADGPGSQQGGLPGCATALVEGRGLDSGTGLLREETGDQAGASLASSDTGVPLETGGMDRLAGSSAVVRAHSDHGWNRGPEPVGSNPVSQKLLEGWAMLGDYCAACFNPIMRSRAGEQRCVVCPPRAGVGGTEPSGTPPSTTGTQGAGLAPFTDPDVALAATVLPLPSEETPGASTPQDSCAPAIAVTLPMEIVLQHPQVQARSEEGYRQPGVEEAGTQALQQPSEGLAGPPLGRSSAPVHPRCASGSGSLGVPGVAEPAAVFEAVHVALVAKMHDLRWQLEKTSNPALVVDVLRAISECTVAIKNVRGLR